MTSIDEGQLLLRIGARSVRSDEQELGGTTVNAPVVVAEASPTLPLALSDRDKLKKVSEMPWRR